MQLLLSGAEQRALNRLNTILLSPHESAVDAWRSKANGAARELLHADCASFMLPTPEGLHLYSDEWGPTIPNAYPRAVEPLDREHGFWARQVKAGVWARRRIFTPEMYRSDYYRNFVVPARAFDAIGVTIETSSRKELAGLLFHHTSTSGPRFADRELQILSLLLPAFRAGVRMRQLFERGRTDMARSVDALTAPVLLVAQDGAVLHANAAASALLGGGHGPAWRAEIARMASFAACAARGCAEVVPCGARQVTIGGRQHTLSITLASSDLPHAFAVMSVRTPEATSPPDAPAPAHVAERFGLTAQECRVARMLAERKSNREIAAALFVSEHTARHHTQHVLAKLGVRSRREVRDALS